MTNLFKNAFGIILLSFFTACNFAGENEKKIDEVSLPEEQIYYTSFRPLQWDIYYSEKPGDSVELLTNNPALDYEAVISPDGKWVVFTSERNGSPDLFAIDLENNRKPQLLIESKAMEDQVAFSSSGDSIAFMSTAGGNADIYIMPFTPGSVQKIKNAENITNNPAGDFRPAFSPDGKNIAFSSDRGAELKPAPRIRFPIHREGDLYLFNLNNKNTRRLTKEPGWDGSPVWSPDGKKIYFYSTREGGIPRRIWALEIESNKQYPIGALQDLAISPALMPDGRIAYTSIKLNSENNFYYLASVSPEDSITGSKREVKSGGKDHLSPNYNIKTGAMVFHGGITEPEINGPEWSSLLRINDNVSRVHNLGDRKINLHGTWGGTGRPPHPKDSRLLRTVISPDFDLSFKTSAGKGKELEKLGSLNALKKEGYPPNETTITTKRWLADGSGVIFTVGPFRSITGTDADIWKINADGSGLVNLTPNSSASDAQASITADGKKIVFRSDRSGKFNLYLMNGDGTNVRQLTDTPEKENFPAISPDGSQIAFSSQKDGIPYGEMQTYELYTLDLAKDGTPGDLRRITNSSSHSAHATYSPDGEWLVYTSGKAGISDEEPLISGLVRVPQMYGELYVYNLSNGHTIRLTNNKWEEGMPYWISPEE